MIYILLAWLLAALCLILLLGWYGRRIHAKNGTTTPAVCKACRGTGALMAITPCKVCNAYGEHVCAACNGAGLRIQQGYEGGKTVARNVLCTSCAGRGRVSCINCAGTGKVKLHTPCMHCGPHSM